MTLLATLDLLLVAGATARLIRLFMVDDLGVETFTDPLHARLASRLSPARRWIADGLWCPYCLGFWLGVLVLGSLALVGGPGAQGGATVPWRYVAGALALNWLVGAVVARVDIGGPGDEEENR